MKFGKAPLAPPITDLRPLLQMLEAVRTEIRATRLHASSVKGPVVAALADKSDKLAAAALPEEETDE